MATEEAPDPYEETERRVIEVVRALAAEVGGGRAERAVSPTASLDREIGLGSLEKVELLARLDAEFGQPFDDRYLALDTPRELATLFARGTPPAAARSGREAAEAPRPVAAPVLPATAAGPARTMPEALWSRADDQPARTHVWMRADDGVEDTITYARLRDEAAAIAGALRDRGLARGDTVGLMVPTGFDFLAAFQGVLLAGGIAVPIYPPARLDRLEEYAARQAAILADAGVTMLLTVARARAVAALLRPRVPTLRLVATVRELAGDGASWPSPEGKGSDPAFIQYTSGSTGAPKGVLLTHDNLLSNVVAVGDALRMTPEDVGASWLPLYHDMGLIGSWLFCLHAGLPIAIQSPLAFLTRPERWLRAIHEHRVTLSPAPNFAYELCARKIPDRALEGLDLSSWRVALNGAEPVNPDTIERFVRRFEPYGFRRQTMFPAYGLAENSVALLFPPPGRGPVIDAVDRESFERTGVAAPFSGGGTPLRFASVGRAVLGHEVKVVDAAGAEVGERVVGRLVFRGPSMTSGYFHKPEATEAIRVAGGFLDTGDLAYRAGGEFYVTGRSKDLIIKAGRNLVPQEIEEAASAVEGIRKGCVVAFGVDRDGLGTEELVIVAETRARDAGEREALEGAVVQRVAAAVGVPPDTVLLAAPGTVPKTSSGKIRRSATRDLYLAGAAARPPATSPGLRLRLLAGAAADAVRDRVAAVRRAAYTAWLALLGPAVVAVFWPPVALLRRQSLAFGLGRTAARVLFRLGGCRLRAEGVEHVRGGPYVLACNHTSFADVLALMALLPEGFVFLAKKEITGWPIISSFIAAGRHLTVDREDVGKSVADAARITRTLDEGTSVLIFPEGTFSASPGLRPFRLGAFRTAADAGRPVVPMAIRGARRVLRDKTFLPRPGPIELWVGEPLHPRGKDWAAVVDLRDRVAAEIARHCGEPRLDVVPGRPRKPSAP
jgi:1-acyl-sn-glycerol-3-phosphate acyltransferase